MYRGQISAYDIFIAFVGFILIFSFLNFLWNQNFLRAFEQQEIILRELTANQTLDVLIKSGGTPGNWENSPGSVEVIGLASKKNVLSQKKLDAFAGLDYQAASAKLRIGRYDFQFELRTGNPATDRVIGVAPPANASVLVLRRNVIYRGADGNVFFKLFET